MISIHFHWDQTWQFQNSMSVRRLLSFPYNMTPEPAEERNLLGRTRKLLSFALWSFAIPLSLRTTTTQPTARLHPGVASSRFRCDHSKLSLQASRKTTMVIGSECQQKPVAMRKKTPQQQWESEKRKNSMEIKVVVNLHPPIFYSFSGRISSFFFTQNL